MLNLARRNAPKTAIRNARKATHEPVCDCMRLNTSAAGATPKLTRSDSESSSFPRAE